MNRNAPIALPEDHPRYFASASLVLGRKLADLDKNRDRKRRKLRVLELRLAQLRASIPEAAALTDLSSVKVEASFTEEEAATLIVDLAFSSPFAPYELDVSQRDFVEALRLTGAEMRLRSALVEHVLVLKGEALGAHTRFFASRWKLALAGVSSAAAAPLLPAFVGAAAGAAAAAAVASRGFALLGAGSLAVGGLQLAGGQWLLTGARSAASSTARAGARQLVNAAPAAAIRVEVAKCQTWVVLHVEGCRWSKDAVAAQLEKLDELEKEVEKDLAKEQQLNDPGAHRIRDLKDKASALATGRDWIATRVGQGKRVRAPALDGGQHPRPVP